jgi:hypothetical protein
MFGDIEDISFIAVAKVIQKMRKTSFSGKILCKKIRPLPVRDN